STILKDEPFEINLGYGLGIWRPQNYNNDFLGPVTLRRALELSRNLATIDIVHRKTGMKCVTEIARRFGIVDDMKPQLAMVLGAAESTLMRMTRAYAILANGGKNVNATLLDRVQDRNGRTLLADMNAVCEGCSATAFQLGEIPQLIYHEKQVADPASVYQVTSILEGVILRGTGKKLSVLNTPIAGKTGTSNEYRDAWFFAYTPNLVAGVYIGFDAPKSLGKHESGTRAASPILLDFMENALKLYPRVPFKTPSGVKLVQVNLKTGKPSSGEGETILEAFKRDDEIDDQASGEEESSTEDVEGQGHTIEGEFVTDENSLKNRENPVKNDRTHEVERHLDESNHASTEGIY
ncbi:MAG: penicillin-binding transpeptidase domain-containing protein, partial [Candidatus Nucleicultricaceae bacterium]